MPSSPTFKQGSHISSPSSTTSNSVLRGLPPYRWQEWIPDITLPEYGTIIRDDDNYEDLMAILFPQSDLYSRTITMWHLFIMAQKLRREVDRQEVKARRIFMRRIRITTGIASISKCTPSRILLTSNTATHSILSCTKPGNKIPYPHTDITTTRDTRKTNPYWRQRQWTRQTKWQLLHCRVNFFHTSLLPPTFSRMHWLMTSVLQMSTIHMQSLLWTSSGTPSVWLFRRTLKLVTSTIVRDIVTNSFSSLTLAYHAFSFPFSYMIDMHFP